MKMKAGAECRLERLFDKPMAGVVLVLTRDTKAGLGLAFEIARRAVEPGHSSRLRLWSWRSFHALDGVMLTGDSLSPGYRWTLTRDMLDESSGVVQPAWMQDSLTDSNERAASLQLGRPSVSVGNGRAYLGDDADVSILEFKGELDLRLDSDVWKLKLLNEAAKRGSQMFFIVLDLSRVFDTGCREDSYAALALRLNLEHGVDLSSCAEAVVLLEQTEMSGTFVDWCRIMRKDGESGRRLSFAIKRDEKTGRFREIPTED